MSNVQECKRTKLYHALKQLRPRMGIDKFQRCNLENSAGVGDKIKEYVAHFYLHARLCVCVS